MRFSHNNNDKIIIIYWRITLCQALWSLLSIFEFYVILTIALSGIGAATHFGGKEIHLLHA